MNKEDLVVDIVDEAKLLLTYSQGALLVNDEGVHYKFYNIYYNDQEGVVAQWGRVGSKPQSTTYGRYKGTMNSKIREKLNKGYRIVRDL